MSFAKFVSKHELFISKLLKLKDQPIYEALDKLIFLSIHYLSNNEQLLLILLKNLKNGGIEISRFQNIIIKVFAYLGKKPETNLIKNLKDSEFINNFIEEDYEQYKTLFEIIRTLNQNPTRMHQAKALLPKLENINIKDRDGDSLLINAVEKDWINNKNIDFIKTLITDKKANVHQPGKAGRTPLMHVAMTRFIDKNQQTELIKFFIDNNANLNTADVFGKNALDYARKANNIDAIEFLEQQTKQTPIQLSIQEQVLTLNNLNSTLISLVNKK